MKGMDRGKDRYIRCIKEGKEVYLGTKGVQKSAQVRVVKENTGEDNR